MSKLNIEDAVLYNARIMGNTGRATYTSINFNNTKYEFYITPNPDPSERIDYIRPYWSAVGSEKTEEGFLRPTKVAKLKKHNGKNLLSKDLFKCEES